MEDGEGGEDESMQDEAEEGRRPLFRKSENQPSSQDEQVPTTHCNSEECQHIRKTNKSNKNMPPSLLGIRQRRPLAVLCPLVIVFSH